MRQIPDSLDPSVVTDLYEGAEPRPTPAKRAAADEFFRSVINGQTDKTR